MSEKKEYIERGAALKESFEVLCEDGGYRMMVAEEDINAIPAADVEPVVRAHWFISEYEFLNCSACGGSYYTGAESTAQAESYLNSGHYFKRCPNCGAHMERSGNK